MTMMAAIEAENEEQMAALDGLMFSGCWKTTFLPSTPPRFISLVEAPKSVRFQLDRNTIHVLPEQSRGDNHDCGDLFITEEEQDATRLDMELTVAYFRRLLLLESRPKNADPATWICPNDVTTIGLEWRIWPDGRFQRRHDINRVVLEHSSNDLHPSLSRNCHAISTISEQLARKRAVRVVKDLKSSSSSQQNTKKQGTAGNYYSLGRWIDIHSLVQRIPLLRQK